MRQSPYDPRVRHAISAPFVPFRIVGASRVAGAIRAGRTHRTGRPAGPSARWSADDEGDNMIARRLVPYRRVASHRKTGGECSNGVFAVEALPSGCPSIRLKSGLRIAQAEGRGDFGRGRRAESREGLDPH
ncbi:hypothetical protein JCM17478_25910 [Thermopirellula anaerolimosa]